LALRTACGLISCLLKTTTFAKQDWIFSNSQLLQLGNFSFTHWLDLRQKGIGSRNHLACILDLVIGKSKRLIRVSITAATSPSSASRDKRGKILKDEGGEEFSGKKIVKSLREDTSLKCNQLTIYRHHCLVPSPHKECRLSFQEIETKKEGNLLW